MVIERDTNETSPVDRPAPWPIAFILMSMDVVEPFLDLMGLIVPSPSDLVGVLRREIVRVRYAFAEARDPVIYSPQETLAAVASKLGSPVSGHVQWWVTEILGDGKDAHRPVGLWTDLLRYALKNPATFEKLDWPQSSAQEVREQIKRVLERSEYERRLVAVYARPLSDWDLHMYAVQLFDDEDPGIPNGPDKYVYRAIMNHQAYRFWAWILKTFDASAIQRLHGSSNAIVATTPELRYLGTLVHPSALDIGL